MKLVSIVVPCFNEQEVLPLFYEQVSSVLQLNKNISYEIILVNDGSKDATLQIMKELSQSDERLKYLSFSKNFGKEAALFAGLSAAKGDYAAIMDADLQDPPEMLISMIEILNEGKYDCVATRRFTRNGEPPIRTFFANRFYKIINKISKTEIVDGARDFRMMKRQMVDAVLSVSEYNRFSKGILSWVGFDTFWLEYKNAPRAAGKTKWNFWQLMLYSFDGIVAFSTAPLIISSFLGIIFCFIAFVLMLFYFIKTLIYGGDPVSGFPTLITAVFLVGGIQLLCIGILGQYLSKTYLETKNRPIYIIKETNI